MSNNEPVGSIDAAIVEGINQRINASVMAALSTDDVFSTLIASALNTPVETERHSRKSEPYVLNLLRKAVSKATREAVKSVIEEQQAEIVEEVRKAVKRSATPLAEALVSSLTSAVDSSYRMKVEIELADRE